jgi:hypothetical protein
MAVVSNNEEVEIARISRDGRNLLSGPIEQPYPGKREPVGVPAAGAVPECRPK